MSQDVIAVPKGWELTTLFDITISHDGKRTPLNKSQRSQIQGKYPYYGASGQVDSINDYKLDGKFILLAEDGENLNSRKKPIAFIVEGKFWVNNHAHVLEPTEKILIDYLCHYINSLNIMKFAKKQSTRPKLNKTDMNEIPILLPSLQIQKQIVAKLDHVLGELEVKKKEILKLKEKKDSAISKLSQKTIGEIILNHMKIDNIPKKWQIKTVEDCVDIQAGFAQGEKNVVNGTIHLRMNNIGRNFQLNYDLTRTINATKEQLIKYKLEKDDVIFNNTNSPELVGKSFIFNDDKVCLYSNHLTRCRVNKELLLPEWLLFYIRGKWLRRDFERMCNKWINQAAFGGNKLKELKIPIPPLDEQKRILKILKNTSMQFERISNLTKAIKNRDEQNKKFIDNIQSSILDSAFSGKLLN